MSPDPIGGLGVVKLQNTVARLAGRGKRYKVYLHLYLLIAYSTDPSEERAGKPGASIVFGGIDE